MKLLANAKLNLRLELVGRRRDGYHLLRMVNIELDLADSLTVAPQDAERPMEVYVNSLGIGCSAESAAAMVCPARSTVIKAVTAFNEEFHTGFSPTVTVEKRIPAQAGLGGGSADAAAMLRWCQATLESDRGTALSQSELERLSARALSLGADVPYALSGGCALVEGVGDLLRPLPWSVGGTPILLVIPSEGVATPKAFARVRSVFPDLAEVEPRSPILPMLKAPGELVSNDLFAIVSSLVPAVAQTADSLREVVSNYAAHVPGGIGALGMTGSGSTLFLVPEQWGPSPGWHSAVAEVLHQHAPSLTTIATTIR